MAQHHPKTLVEMKQAHRPVRNVNTERHEQLSALDRSALFVTNHIGTMGFFILILLWTASWLGWNIFAPSDARFDPYPAFVLWLFISNMIQIMLMPLIMIGQNLQGKHAEARAEADFEVNVRAEQEIEAILQHLENQNELILDIISRLEKEQK